MYLLPIDKNLVYQVNLAYNKVLVSICVMKNNLANELKNIS